MTNFKPPNQSSISDNDIDLMEVISIILMYKKQIVVITSIIAIASIIYVLVVPSIYTSNIILASAEEQSDSLSSIGSSDMGGIASSIAGFGMGRGKSNKTTNAINIMKSWGFIEEFIEKNNLADELYAVKRWDSSHNELVIKDSKYDIKKGQWLVTKPTSWELFQEFSNRFSVYHDERTGFISMSIDYYSPYIAKEWVDLMVVAINDHMREKSLRKNNSNIKYLQEQIQKTSITEMREIFYKLIEEQTRSKMIAEATPEYVFTTVSIAMAPEIRTFPKRKVLVVAITFVGGLLTILAVLIRHYITLKKKS